MHPALVSGVRSSLIVGILLLPIAASLGQQEKKDPGAAPPPDPDRAILDDLLAAHNKVREGEHLPPLGLDDRLIAAARGHARDMARRNKLTHEGDDGSDVKTRIKRAGYHYKEIGENVAAGQETPGEAMQSWIDSPPHRANLLGDFTQMGGAVARGSDGKNYWCVDFGRPMPTVDPERSPADLVAALNRARAGADRKKLRIDPQLARVAARFARDAAERQSVRAKDRDGRTPFDVLEKEGFRARRFAVTFATGEGDPTKVVSGWLDKPQDRKILMSAFDRIGAGVAADEDGVPYWVILLSQGGAR